MSAFYSFTWVYAFTVLDSICLSLVAWVLRDPATQVTYVLTGKDWVWCFDRGGPYSGRHQKQQFCIIKSGFGHQAALHISSKADIQKMRKLKDWADIRDWSFARAGPCSNIAI